MPSTASGSANKPPAPPLLDGRYFRKGLGLRQEARQEVEAEYRSLWVDAFRLHGHVLAIRVPGGRQITLRLAREFGFCYGVERSVDYAYETLKRFPGRRIVLTGEIIHNPRVNARLRQLGISFLGDPEVPDESALAAEDVVVLPAFGVASPQFDRIRQSGAIVVDTTCGSVLNVWKNVERYARDGLTSLIHGKVEHEETRATVSRALLHAPAHTIVVLDLAEARLVAAFIRGTCPAKEFQAHFPPPKTSVGFSPEEHLQRVGVANQTTMLSSESLEIAALIRDALEARYADTSSPARFRSFDTICSATQDRQDALAALIGQPLDLLLVIGGFNSSNTGHLAEMAHGVVPAWHIEGPDGLLSSSEILHKPVEGGSPKLSRNWLPPAGDLAVGITAGASTPDAAIGGVVERLLDLHGIGRQGALDLLESKMQAGGVGVGD